MRLLRVPPPPREILRERLRLLGRELAVDAPFDLDGRARVAEAEAVDGLERHRAVGARLADAKAERVLHPADRSIGARRVARRALADLHARSAAPLGAEIAVVRRDAPHRGLGLTARARDRGDVVLRDDALLVHHVLEPLERRLEHAEIAAVPSELNEVMGHVSPQGKGYCGASTSASAGRQASVMTRRAERVE